MSKKYLGLICLLYSGIFIYVLIFDKLKLFLAPQMHLYIKLSIIPLFLIGVIMLFFNTDCYKFKLSDLVLILPLILLVLAGNGRLTSNFSNNKTGMKHTDNIISNTKTAEEISDRQEEKEDVELYDFDIVDSNYYDLAYYITFSTNIDEYAGKTIRVRGFVNDDENYLPKGYFGIGKYGVSCCTADASYLGFAVKKDSFNIINNNWYEIIGYLEKAKDLSNHDILAIKIKSIKKINSKKEELYVYPCYSYDDGKCKDVKKYGIGY